VEAELAQGGEDAELSEEEKIKKEEDLKKDFLSFCVKDKAIIRQYDWRQLASVVVALYAMVEVRAESI
jgi:hypothetical protein